MVGKGIHGFLVIAESLLQPQGVGEYADLLAVVLIDFFPYCADLFSQLGKLGYSQHIQHFCLGVSCRQFGSHGKGDIGIDGRPYPVDAVSAGKDFFGAGFGKSGNGSLCCHYSLRAPLPLDKPIIKFFGVDIEKKLVVNDGELRVKIIIKPVSCIEFVLANFSIIND